jgi:hypothetical protein
MVTIGVVTTIIGGGDITARTTIAAGGGIIVGSIVMTTDGTPGVIAMTGTIETIIAGAGIDGLPRGPACCNAQHNELV